MKVIIAGSRSITDYRKLENAMDHLRIYISEIVSGCANGVDKLGEDYAHNYLIEIKRFPADWSKGKSAGYARNFQMGTYADALVALWDGKSKGTKHMIDIMLRLAKPTFVFFA